MPTLRPHTITATTATISTTLLITSTICSMMIRVMPSVTSSPLSGARTAHHCLNFVLLTKMRRYLLYLKLSRGPPIDTMVFQTDGWILYELVRLLLEDSLLVRGTWSGVVRSNESACQMTVDFEGRS